MLNTSSASNLPDNIDALKALLAAQQEQIETQKQQIESKEHEIQSKEQKIQSLTGKIEAIQEQLRLAISKQFGPSTEKYIPEQKDLFFNEAEAQVIKAKQDGKTTKVASHNRKKKGRVALPPELPRVEVIHDIAEDEKVCPHDGHTLHKIGEEVSEQLELIPAKIQVIRNIRYRYGCRECEQTIKTVPAPKQILPKSIATPELLAHILVSKYQDALPLYRQEGILKRYGINLPRATLSNWVLKVSESIQPLINLMKDRLLQGPVIYCDETPVQVLKAKKKASAKSYMWVQVGGLDKQSVILFDYASSRSQQVPLQLLADYQGILMTDGYEAYNAVVNKETITHVGCWAHVRRKFDEANKGSSTPSPLATQALEMIADIYDIERDIKGMPPDERQAIRQKQSQPVLNQLRQWLIEHQPQVPPESLLGKALYYLDSQWPKLIRYVKDGHTPIDNNRAENAIRPFVVGRKNWLFANTVKGATASANLYSLIETAKANGQEPFAYLTHILRQLPYAKAIEDYEVLLPWQCPNQAE